jgi:hypothetical protein
MKTHYTYLVITTQTHSLSYKNKEEKDVIERAVSLLRTAGAITTTLHKPYIKLALNRAFIKPSPDALPFTL